MALDYASAAATAKRLIEANGRTVTFRKLDRTPSDSSKPWRGANLPRGGGATELSGKGVFVDPASASKLGYQLLNETLVNGVEQIIIVAATSFAGQSLELFDEVVDGGVSLRIVKTDMLQPGGVRLLYYFQVLTTGSVPA